VKLAAATAARYLRLEVHASTQHSGSSHNERIEHNLTMQQTHMLQYKSFRPGVPCIHPSLSHYMAVHQVLSRVLTLLPAVCLIHKRE
jgi:hypothetical protein